MKANLTSSHTSPLGLPNKANTILPPNVTVKVPDWEILKNNSVVKAWMKAGILSVQEDEAEDDGGETDTSQHGLKAIRHEGKYAVVNEEGEIIEEGLTRAQAKKIAAEGK